MSLEGMQDVIRQPAFYLSHGGGPWSFMGGEFRQMFRHLEASLNDLPSQLPMQPSAVLLISGHWEETEFAVSTSAAPGMIYDYDGFPAETYQLSYPAAGHPGLAELIAITIEQAGWPAKRDSLRGFDHGTFSLMKAIFPEANVPIVQLSMKANLDPAEHFKLGMALSHLREKNILMIGSGQSFHNMRSTGERAKKASLEFDKMLRQVLLKTSPKERFINLLACLNSPCGHYSHPRTDHIIPLLVVLGAAENDPASCIFSNYIMQFATSSYAFGAPTIRTNFDSLHGDEDLSLGVLIA
jgi:aromatic ring-opening dioxygenase catalytic subunit (LigB family)